MKRYVYFLCFIALVGSINACKKNDDPVAQPEVVGRWMLNRALLSGFPGSYSYVNGQSLDLYYYESIGSTVDIFSDKTFNLNYRNGTVSDATGTWDYTNQQLKLTYDTGGDDTYTYAKNKNIEELTSTNPVSYTLTLPSSVSSNVGVYVPGRFVPIYRK